MLEQQSFPFGKTKRKSPESIRRLSLREVFLLASLVRTEYTLSGKDDPAFATWASEKLAIPGINRNHIATSREIHGIQALRFAKAAEAAVVTPHDKELYSRVLTLERQVRKLFAATDKLDMNYKPPEPTQDQAYDLWEKIYNNAPATSCEVRTYLFALAILRGDWK